ncbi:MAG TPA: uroporphyrinogen-III synthase [Sphingopyxis sp.]|nr:uroporphyrinogen-III synthase [Sphingopyxis sp.]
MHRCAPALRIVAAPAPPLTAVPDALVFTSLNGVRLHRFSPALAGLPVFAVGDHSARYARAQGYRRVTSAAGNIVDLCQAIQLGLRAPADILHIGAVSPAGDLAAMLGSSYRVRRLPVYSVEESDPRDLEWIAGRLAEIGHILVHSPRAGDLVARWLGATLPHWSGVAHCISPAAASPLRSLPGVSTRISDRPNERSLLAALVENRQPEAPLARQRTVPIEPTASSGHEQAAPVMLDFPGVSAILRSP